MGDSGTDDYAEEASLMNEFHVDNPSDIGEKTLMDVQDDFTILISSESAPIVGEDHVPTSKDGCVVVLMPIEDILVVLDSTTTPEGGALETLDSGKIEVYKGPNSSGSQPFVKSSSL